MILGNELLQLLRGLGIGTLCIPRGFKCRGDYLQCIAVQLLIGKYEVCPEGMGKVALMLSGDARLLRGDLTKCDASLTRVGTCPKPLNIALIPPREPLFIVDLALWHRHTESEKNELVEQLLASISTVRNYLWDGNLVFSSINDEIIKRIARFAVNARFRVIIDKGGPPSILNSVFLDPEGDCVLNEELIGKTSAFIIGGIVDKERRTKGESYELYMHHKLTIPRCRIELRGSVVGVPDRINKIIEIILRTRYETHNLERAIIMSMSKRDRINRLFYELQRASYTVRGVGLKVIPSPMLEHINWMNATNEEVKMALMKARVNVVSYEEFLRYLEQGVIKEGPWSRRYAHVVKDKNP
ncbi:tRNA (adenine(9)-N1)-methyltransferase Trm10 [Vulcanisaeta thermophila]|uniref:tRNA (adenine(9)-N1)-methyltransferase Trm10 n=1 Tax=Vulcanisaeta thermophila TaxID=867917 RepID=UPI000852E78A|nr:tRNA (adenine(9)-N1)-methyltransferase Trm10 [Vulcanisaeta thermophila]